MVKKTPTPRLSEVRKLELDVITLWNTLLEAAFSRFDHWMMKSAAARRAGRKRARLS